MQRHSILLTLAAVSLTLSSGFSIPAKANDIELKVGIIQRFGDEEKDQLSLSAANNDILTFRFLDNNNKPQSLQAKTGTIGITKQPLPAPVLEERLVLSEHSTFETAEDSANQWKALGIQVEVTQPERWQVWAKRDVYNSPLVRRWLVQSLKAKGYDLPRLDSSIVNAKPQTVLTVNGQKYLTSSLEVTGQKNLIQVTNANGKAQKLYGGSLKLQPNAYGTYTLVNNVPLEIYLRGVVPHEIGRNAPDNAAKAQTIIARTYALRNLRRFEADNYELCADTHCQVYFGLKDTSPQADRAIAETKGLVLTYENELVDALYSSTTGGITARFTDVWNGGERPYLKSIIDSAENVWNLSQQSLENEADFRKFIALEKGFNETGRQVFRWRYESTLETLNKDIRTYLTKRKNPLANFTTIQNMEIVKRSPSGRILLLRVQTDKGTLELAKNEVRSAFSAPRSTLFYIDPVYDKQKNLKSVVFTGGGLGHGVGMSQYGSYKLAQLGWSPEKILSFYYPGTKMQILSNQIVFWRGN